tara:strand:+ start:1801 stop:2208 length:408 start_codon:yes stop_codon:yes gene_type:complete
MLKIFCLIIYFFISIAFANNTLKYDGHFKPFGKSIKYPVISSFEMTNSGTVIGTYEVYDDGDNDGIFEEKDFGVYYDGLIDGERMKIYWTDKWGRGYLDIIFDDQMRSFKGTYIPIENGNELDTSGTLVGKLVSD